MNVLSGVALDMGQMLYGNQSINQSKYISIAPYVASESEAHDDGN